MKNSTADLITAGLVGGVIWWYLRRSGNPAFAGLGRKQPKAKARSSKKKRTLKRKGGQAESGSLAIDSDNIKKNDGWYYRRGVESISTDLEAFVLWAYMLLRAVEADQNLYAGPPYKMLKAISDTIIYASQYIDTETTPSQYTEEELANAHDEVLHDMELSPLESSDNFAVAADAIRSVLGSIGYQLHVYPSGKAPDRFRVGAEALVRILQGRMQKYPVKQVPAMVRPFLRSTGRLQSLDPVLADWASVFERSTIPTTRILSKGAKGQEVKASPLPLKLQPPKSKFADFLKRTQKNPNLKIPGTSTVWGTLDPTTQARIAELQRSLAQEQLSCNSFQLQSFVEAQALAEKMRGEMEELRRYGALSTALVTPLCNYHKELIPGGYMMPGQPSGGGVLPPLSSFFGPPQGGTSFPASDGTEQGAQSSQPSWESAPFQGIHGLRVMRSPRMQLPLKIELPELIR